jgi:hypothetical protein
MNRKKWTPKEVITEESQRFNEKRKWQIALRRYVLEQKAAPAYAPYFGLDIVSFRNWIEIQFTKGLNWENFGSNWQFDHIVPVSYFNFNIESDLKLCWNFINIRVGKLDQHETGTGKVEVIAAKNYFKHLHSRTDYHFCSMMLDKIRELETIDEDSNKTIEDFIQKNKSRLEVMSGLTIEEFSKLNSGTALEDIELEREILKKFTS